MNTQERLEGPTPSGGAYAIVCFMDENHNPTSKERAKHFEITEYGEDDERLLTTYA